MKGFVFGVVTLLILTSAVFASGGFNRSHKNNNEISIVLDGDELIFPRNSKPIISNGKVYVSVEALFEQFDYDVKWDRKTGTVDITWAWEDDYTNSDDCTADRLSKALTAYMIETGDVDLEFLADDLNVDTIIEALQQEIILPTYSDQTFGPYIVQILDDESDGNGYYPEEDKGWHITINKNLYEVSFELSTSNEITFIE